MFTPLAVAKGPKPSSSSRVPAKRLVGAPDHPLEAQADRIAHHVLGATHRPAGAPAKPSTRVAAPAHSGGFQASPGQPLDLQSRAFFESHFGYDFSSVRIHAGDEAAHSSRALGANAYTAGSDIAFAAGRFQTATPQGRRLLAHELTHVVQQGHAPALAGMPAMTIPYAPEAPAIQRDTPKGQPAPIGPRVDGPVQDTPPVTSALRQEVTETLTDFLYKAQAEQGGQSVRITESVRWAILKLFQGDMAGYTDVNEFLKRPILPGSAPELAAAVTKYLPQAIPRSRMAHLGTQSPKDTPDTRPKSVGEAAGHTVVDPTVALAVKKLKIPQSWKDKIVEGARGAIGDGLVAILDQAMSEAPMSGVEKAGIHSLVEGIIKQKAATPMDRQQNGAGSPYAQAQPPQTAPPIGIYKAPGEHIFSLPKIPWDFPNPTVPKPNLPQAPVAGNSQAMDKLVQGLDDKSLVPSAAKGKPNEGNFASAQEFARSVANLLAEADKKKQSSLTVTLSADYRHVDDLAVLFDKMSAIVRQVAATLPGGAANVGEVILTPANNGPKDTLPARRIVRLHGSD